MVTGEPLTSFGDEEGRLWQCTWFDKVGVTALFSLGGLRPLVGSILGRSMPPSFAPSCLAFRGKGWVRVGVCVGVHEVWVQQRRPFWGSSSSSPHMGHRRPHQKPNQRSESCVLITHQMCPHPTRSTSKQAWRRNKPPKKYSSPPSGGPSFHSFTTTHLREEGRRGSKKRRRRRKK